MSAEDHLGRQFDDIINHNYPVDFEQHDEELEGLLEDHSGDHSTDKFLGNGKTFHADSSKVEDTEYLQKYRGPGRNHHLP